MDISRNSDQTVESGVKPFDGCETAKLLNMNFSLNDSPVKESLDHCPDSDYE